MQFGLRALQNSPQGAAVRITLPSWAMAGTLEVRSIQVAYTMNRDSVMADARRRPLFSLSRERAVRGQADCPQTRAVLAGEKAPTRR